MKLIDKDALVAEIERYKHKADERLKIKGRALVEDTKDLALQNLCGELLSFLDTLEVKEVDLDKELDYDDYIKFFNEHPNYSNGDWGFEETWEFGQYCYKLGLKAQKGE